MPQGLNFLLSPPAIHVHRFLSSSVHPQHGFLAIETLTESFTKDLVFTVFSGSEVGNSFKKKRNKTNETKKKKERRGEEREEKRGKGKKFIIEKTLKVSQLVA